MKLNSLLLNSPTPLSTYGGIHLTYLMRLSYLARGDLASRFSLDSKLDRTVFLIWYLLNSKEFFHHSEYWQLKPSWELLGRPSPEYGKFDQAPLTTLTVALWFALPLPKIYDLSITEDRLKIEMAVSAWPKGEIGIPLVYVSEESIEFGKQPEPSLPSFEGVQPVTVFQYVIWQMRGDVQGVFQLDTREGQAGYLNWFTNHGSSELDLRGFRARPVKTDFHSSTAPPIRQVKAKDKSTDAMPFGLNQFGSANGGSGMARHSQLTAMSAAAAGVPVCFIDFGIESSDPVETRIDKKLICEKPKFFLNVSSFNIDGVPNFLGRLQPDEIDKTYNVFFGNWEYPDLPATSRSLINMYDEAWAASQFALSLYSRSLSIPVHKMPLAVTVEPTIGLTREYFGLPKSSFLFLFTFDYYSWVSRKNPEACIRAFMRAFPAHNETTGLIIKTKNVHSRHEHDSRAWAEAKELAAQDPRIKIIEQDMDDFTLHDLMRCCDAYISLHRAEGFGFSIAEAMLLGKPTICTNYSGNTDFANEQNSLPVRYELVSLDDETSKILGMKTVWAEPDIEHAAAHMSAVFNDRTLYSRLSRAGAEYISERYNPKAVGLLLKRRLEMVFQRHN